MFGPLYHLRDLFEAVENIYQKLNTCYSYIVSSSSLEFSTSKSLFPRVNLKETSL